MRLARRGEVVARLLRELEELRRYVDADDVLARVSVVGAAMTVSEPASHRLRAAHFKGRAKHINCLLPR